jgi:hypothetical protein
MPIRAAIAVLLVLGLIAAGCGDDSGEGLETTTSTVPDDTTTTAADNADETPTTTEPVELTASFRGVTPEVIKIGVSTFDWERLAALGVRGGIGNSEDIFVAVLEAINDRGGIHGRMLELHTVNYLPVGTNESEAACVELTEDHEVFVVGGGALGDGVLCYTEFHDTAVVLVDGMTEDRKERARAPYATVANETAERPEAFVAAMDELGLLEGATLGVIGSIDISELDYSFTMEALQDAGYDPVGGLIGDNNDDLTASARDSDLIYERFRASGVNVTISTTGAPLEMTNAINAGYETDEWLLLNSMSGSSLNDEGVDPFYLDGAYSVNPTPVGTAGQPAMADDPAVAACVDDVNARTGRTVPYELDVEISSLGQTLAACAIAAILEAGLTNAGPELTNDTFQAGLEAIGPIDLAGYPPASLGPGDLSASSQFGATRFDAENEVWEPLG